MNRDEPTTAALSSIPAHLAIRILYSDDDIVVIDKPCDLRSVPGNANPPPPEKLGIATDAVSIGDSINSTSPRLRPQEAWILAIKKMSSGDDNGGSTNIISTEDAEVKELIHNLGSIANPSCVPRKLETFVKYIHRNSKRLLPSFVEINDEKVNDCEPRQKKQRIITTHSSRLTDIANMAYAEIQCHQRRLMNLPTPTEDWESAVGQLRMLGYGDHDHNCVTTATKESGNTKTDDGTVSNNNDNTETNGHDCTSQNTGTMLYVVHRLDCQTSGVMVVARNQEASSQLCRAWRERELVQKVYLAHVRHWPPYHNENLNEGTIDIPLGPSRTERIKWEVYPVADGGKECKTDWKVCQDLHSNGLILELKPITGRTHQLRLHCAAIGSGIVGDSLYGENPIEWSADGNQIVDGKYSVNDAPKTLRLHAHKLTFPHPTSGERITFESPANFVLALL